MADVTVFSSLSRESAFPLWQILGISFPLMFWNFTAMFPGLSSFIILLSFSHFYNPRTHVLFWFFFLIWKHFSGIISLNISSPSFSDYCFWNSDGFEISGSISGCLGLAGLRENKQWLLICMEFLLGHWYFKIDCGDVWIALNTLKATEWVTCVICEFISIFSLSLYFYGIRDFYKALSRIVYS